MLVYTFWSDTQVAFLPQTTKHTQQPSNTILQRAVDFVSAYGLGFSAEDAIALLRIEDLFVETFEVSHTYTSSAIHDKHIVF